MDNADIGSLTVSGFVKYIVGTHLKNVLALSRCMLRTFTNDRFNVNGGMWVG